MRFFLLVVVGFSWISAAQSTTKMRSATPDSVWESRGFPNPSVTLWNSELLGATSKPDFNGLELVAVAFRDKGWTLEQVKGHLKTVAENLSQCQVRISRAEVVMSDTPYHYMFSATDTDGDLSRVEDSIAKPFRYVNEPVLFFAGRISASTFVRTYLFDKQACRRKMEEIRQRSGKGNVSDSRCDVTRYSYPKMHTVWMSRKYGPVEKQMKVSKGDPLFHTLSQSIAGIVLPESAAVPDKEDNILNGTSSKFNSFQCTYMKASKFIYPPGGAAGNASW